MNRNCLCSWSGGKDSCFALMQSVTQGYQPKVLLNVLNEAGKISRSHGIPLAVLERQANACGLPLKAISSSWQDYEQHFSTALTELKQQFDLSYAVFGDIDLDAHRAWEEMVCAKAGLAALLPLWKHDRKELVNTMLAAGIETMIVSCNTLMGERFLGKMLNQEIIQELELLGVDVCGENGEFHTLVINCPLFKHRIDVNVVQKIQHNDYWFSELE